MKLLETSQQLFINLMNSVEKSPSTKNIIPGKTCVPIKRSIYPGKQAYKSKFTPSSKKKCGRRR